MDHASEQVVHFRLERRRYALRLAAVAGVGEAERLRRVPGSAPVAMGLSEWRGRLLTIVDLPRLLGDRPASRRQSLIRLAHPFEEIAFYVPAVVRLSRIATPPRQSPPQALQAVQHDAPLYLIDPRRVLHEGGVAPRA